MSLFSRIKGQVGVEYLVFTAFLLIVTVILFGYAFVSYSSTVQLIQAQSAVDSVASTVDFVYSKGPGNSVEIAVTLPAGLTEFRVDQNVVRATIRQGGGDTVVFAFTKAKINPNYLFFESGPYPLRVTMNDVNASVVNT